MSVGFLIIAAAMTIAGLAAIWTGSDPAMLSFGQTLMIMGSVGVTGGVVVGVLSLVLMRLGDIASLLRHDAGYHPDDTMAEPDLIEPQKPVPQPAPVAAEPAPLPSAGTTPPMQVQPDLPPPPPRRVPGYLASAAAGAAAGAATAFSFSRKSRDEADVKPETAVDEAATKPKPPVDDLEAMLVEVLGTNARVPPPPPAEPLELDIPAMPLHAPEAVVEPEAEITEPEPAMAEADDKPLDTDPEPEPEPEKAPEGPTLLREGVIATIPFRLYSDGSIIAEIEGAEQNFATLKDFRDYVGG